jgi:hypothetical protein
MAFDRVAVHTTLRCAASSRIYSGGLSMDDGPKTEGVKPTGVVAQIPFCSLKRIFFRVLVEIGFLSTLALRHREKQRSSFYNYKHVTAYIY